MNEVQDKEFDTLNEIIKILKAHNLRYYAIGGTCIGAIRHKGFIPWDDDIDIAMPRPDYELFKNQYYKELTAPYKKLDYNDVSSDHQLFIKIYDLRTTQIEIYAKDYPERYTGAFVDIMPLDGFPSDKNKGERLLRKIKFLDKLNRFNRPYYFYKDPKKPLSRMKKSIKILTPKIHKFDYYSNKIRDEMSCYDYESSKKVFFTWRATSKISEKRKIFDKSFFESIKEVPFESGYICVPSGYEDYLSQDFGDYMVLPPLEMRNSGHNVFISDMGRPCSYYKKLFEEGKL